MHLKQIHDAVWWHVGWPKGICFLYRNDENQLLTSNGQYIEIEDKPKPEYEWILDVGDYHVEGMAYTSESHYVSHSFQGQKRDCPVIKECLVFSMCGFWKIQQTHADHAILSLRVKGYLLDTWILDEAEVELVNSGLRLRFLKSTNKPVTVAAIFRYEPVGDYIQGSFTTSVGEREEIYIRQMSFLDVRTALDIFRKQYQQFFISLVRQNAKPCRYTKL